MASSYDGGEGAGDGAQGLGGEAHLEEAPREFLAEHRAADGAGGEEAGPGSHGEGAIVAQRHPATCMGGGGEKGRGDRTGEESMSVREHHLATGSKLRVLHAPDLLFKVSLSVPVPVSESHYLCQAVPASECHYVVQRHACVIASLVVTLSGVVTYCTGAECSPASRSCQP